ncbi:MAG: hypothetical protein K0S01_2554 [Herbinix sp.]|jgi:5-formyltetrahydrofolate cyclo-ligase|nr:hypothetical protein [Herbinix sp.]
MSKEEIRKELKKLRNLLSTEDQKSFSDAICDSLIQSKEYTSCSHLFTFVSFGSEISTLEIIRQALINHKRVYIPKVEVHGIEFYEIHSLDGLIPSKFGVLEPVKQEENRYKVIEMDKETDKDRETNTNKEANIDKETYIDKETNIEKETNRDKGTNRDKELYMDKATNLYDETKIDNLMLLPGLAFDPTGNRIGYGAGYYDRYLSTYPPDHFYKIALAYDFQIKEKIIASEYDVKADAILTPTRRIQCW